MAADRAAGMILMHALGDALGAPFEFDLGRLSEYDGRFTLPFYHKSRHSGTRECAKGQFTDDTEMTLALAAAVQSAIAQKRELRADDVISAYLRWGATAPPFMGRNTRRLFRGVTTIKGYQQRYKVQFPDKATAEKAQSNGCLMRATPLAVYAVARALSPADTLNVVSTDVKTSNPSSVAVAATQAYVVILADLVQGRKGPDARPYLRRVTDAVCAADKLPCCGGAAGGAVKSVIMSAMRVEARDVSGPSKGWVMHALWCAVRAVTRAAEAMDAGQGAAVAVEQSLHWAVRQGGDTDTNAAIAGGMVGALLGRALCLSDPGTKENLRIVLSADTRSGAVVRPPQYSPPALVEWIKFAAGALAAG